MPAHFGIEASAILMALGRSAEAERRYDALANHNDPWKTIFRGKVNLLTPLCRKRNGSIVPEVHIPNGI